MALSALSILTQALTDIVDLDGDNTVLVQHLTVVINNLATGEMIKAHPELAPPAQKPDAEAVNTPEGVTVQ